MTLFSSVRTETRCAWREISEANAASEATSNWLIDHRQPEQTADRRRGRKSGQRVPNDSGIGGTNIRTEAAIGAEYKEKRASRGERVTKSKPLGRHLN